MTRLTFALLAILAAGACVAQENTAAKPEAPAAGDERSYTIPAGTKIPLQLINSVSTKTAEVGDKVYMQTNFPIMAEGRVVIPAGSYVSATVGSVKRAGKVKGRAELFIRFDALTLPNGVTRDFRATVSNIDGTNPGRVDKTEGRVEGDTNKAGDVTKVGEAAAWGTMIGGVAARTGTGAGIGAAAGAAAGLAGILLSRGPDAILERGSTVEMVLDKTMKFTDKDIANINGTGQVNVASPARADTSNRGRFPFNN